MWRLCIERVKIGSHLFFTSSWFSVTAIQVKPHLCVFVSEECPVCSKKMSVFWKIFIELRLWRTWSVVFKDSRFSGSDHHHWELNESLAFSFKNLVKTGPKWFYRSPSELWLYKMLTNTCEVHHLLIFSAAPFKTYVSHVSDVQISQSEIQSSNSSGCSFKYF